MQVIKFAIITILLSFEVVSAITDKVVCYYGSWSVYRNSKGKFTIEDIDPNLCTHAIYTFVGINLDGSIRIMDEYNEVYNNGFKRFNGLKKLNPNLKTLVAIGGWNEGSAKFSKVAASASLRKVLVNNAVTLLSTYGFDGFDLDWEYPGQRDGSSLDKANFIELVKELRATFDKYGYLLTAAVAAAATSVDISYNVPALSKYLDFINVMTYDLHGSWEKFTGHNAPLYPSSQDVTAAAKELNVVACINAWIERGASPKKLILGIGIYGRSYTLADPNNAAIGAPAIGAGLPGPYTSEAGMLGYNEICEMQLSGQWAIAWSDEQQVPYTHLKNQWVGYDNPKSVTLKVNFAKKMLLGGAMIWSIETDDFRGVCGSKYPILSAINAAIRGGSSENSSSSSSTSTASSATTASPSATTAATQTTVKDGVAFECKGSGHFRDPLNCSRFYYCLKYGTLYIKYTFNCSKDLVYDPERNVCDYPSAVKC
ncbi:hypothetical protein ILUMI_06797 [Ignelater luminosus]|uniref:chitinase n=1 Tax=Ignelater luminosus TaxID=2038154 RepID=A0A8K0D4Q6_IGNLU|nr:hypothetical protein ILUMI_06797 [Ignelater luminosus]